MICNKCGANCAEGDKFCISCGATLTEVNSMPQQPSVQNDINQQPNVPPQQQYYYQQPYNYNQPMYQMPQPQQPVDNGNGFAVASLVLGILSIFCIPPIISSLLAIIFGALAKSKGNKGGMPIAGIVCGIIGLVIFTVYVIVAVEGAMNSSFYYYGTYI